MNILWIEDKPKCDKIDEVLFPDKYFKNGLNRLDIPDNFDKCLEAIENAYLEYDLVVFDINLEDFENTPTVDNIAKGFQRSPGDFLREAGFYLFQKLIRKGFRDDRLVFLTGHASNAYRINSLKNQLEQEENSEKFEQIIDNLMNLMSDSDAEDFERILEQFQNTGEFKPITHFLESISNKIRVNARHKDLYDLYEEKFRNALVDLAPSIHKKDVSTFHAWLEKHLNIDYQDVAYMVLRRGIIEACRTLGKELKEKGEDWILFNRTITENGKAGILDVQYVSDYLTKLEIFFPLYPSNKKVLYYRFLKELSAEWEMSKGKFENYIHKDSQEFNFKQTCHVQMKLLRNWTAHDQIASDLSEKNIAFFFMLAMRGWFDIDLNSIQHYEEVLSCLFSNVPKRLNDKAIKQLLAKSYQKLRKRLGHFNPIGNYYCDLIKSFVKKFKDKQILKSNSLGLFYWNFWHGLFPARLNIDSQRDDKDSVAMFINFDYNTLKQGSFPEYLGLLIFQDTSI